MILIGQYDSPFVRRVAIALHLYEMPYEHRPWSTFGDAARIAAFNPLTRVPTLVLDDGEVLIESGAILDHLDELVGPERALIARAGPTRRHALKICALASGAADKTVALIYERALHQQTSAVLVARLQNQIGGAFSMLDASRAAAKTPYWFGARIGHADIVAACAWRLAREAHPVLFESDRWPALAAHAASCGALPAFQSVAQEFVGPP